MYKLLNEEALETPLNANSILEITLKNRGVKDIEKYKNPSVSSELDFRLLKNIEKGVELFDKHKDGTVVIVTDRDADGLTSSAILQSYIEKNFSDCKVSNTQHPERANGLTSFQMKTIKKMKPLPDLVILPDASSNDIKQHLELNKLGVAVLVLDHHAVDNPIADSADTVVINPQLSPDYSNKDIAGVGVTYKFLQALDEKYGLESADDNIDLVAVGNITDSIDIRSEETRSLIVRGLNSIKNKFIIKLINEFKNSKVETTPHALSWGVFPKLNALIRVGSMKELQFIYSALLGREDTFENKRARSEAKRFETWEEKAVRLCKNAYNRQRKKRDSLKKVIIEEANKNEWNNSPVVLATMEESFDSAGLTGYIAGNLTNEFEKPVILTSYNSETNEYTGSLRANDALPNLKSFLEKSGLCTVRGHEGAAGVMIPKENVAELREYIKDNASSSEVVTVDFIIKHSELTNELISHVDSLEKYWGKNVEPPVFAVTDVELPISSLNAGNNISKWSLGNKEIATFSLPSEIAVISDDIDKTIQATVIGNLSINHFFNYRQRKTVSTPQIMAKAFKVHSIEEEENLFGFEF